MKNTIDIVGLLKPLFDSCEVAMKPASESSLSLFSGKV